MKLTPSEEAMILEEVRKLFDEQDATPSFIVETRADINFQGGLTLGLSITKSDSSDR